MAENPDQTAFFREGLSRYAQARETVNYFQTCVQDAVSRAFEAKTSWKHFHPTLGEGGLELNRGMGSVFIHTFVSGMLPNRHLAKVWLSAGLYWNAPLRGPATVVAASHCWVDGAGTSVPFNNQKSNGVIVGSLYKRNERRLLLPVSEDFDPEASFGLLLDTADDALGPADDLTQAPLGSQ